MSENGERNPTDKKDSKASLRKKRVEKKPEEGLKSFWNVALVGSGLVVLVGLAMMALSVRARSSANSFLEYIDGYDEGEFLLVLAVVGFVSALVGVFGAAVCYLSSSPKKYKRIRYLVLAYIGWGIGLIVLLLVSFWLTFSAVGSLDLVFKPGFTASLVKYVKEKKIRSSIDTLQRELGCCGSYNHTEWFTVSWSEVVSKTDSAIPESCCDTATVAAQRIQCVTSAPFGETIKLTPYQRGCVKAAIKYYGSTLNIRGAMMIGIGIIEIAVVILVILEVSKANKEAEAAAAADEKGKLLAKTEEEKQQRASGAAKGSNASETDVGTTATTTATAATPAVPGYAPGAYGYPAASPYGAGYGAVPGYGGQGYQTYYGGH